MNPWDVIAAWMGWPLVVAFLMVIGGYGYWVLNNRIEGLKENNEILKTKLEETEKLSPDILIERLATRHKILCEELERLHSDEQGNNEKIKNLELERKKIMDELGNIISKLFKSIDGLTGNDCKFCSAYNELSVKVPVELAGRKLTFMINAKCYKCGRRRTEVASISEN